MANWYVATTGDDGTGDGSQGNPYLTIGKGIDVCGDGDTVMVESGTYADEVGRDKTTAGLDITIESVSSIYSDVIVKPKTLISGNGGTGIGTWLRCSSTATFTLKNITFIFDNDNITNWGDFTYHLLLWGYKTGASLSYRVIGCFFYNIADSSSYIRCIWNNSQGNIEAYKCTYRGWTIGTDGYCLRISAASTGNRLTVEDCLFEGNNVCISKHASVNLTEDYNCFYNNTVNSPAALGAHSITDDPEFTEADGATLTTGSPCIDAGVTVAGYVEDYIGDAPDMGCAEAPLPYGFVPPLLGLSAADAETALIAAGFILGNTNSAYNDDYSVGEVYESYPVAGAYILLGEAVDIYVSLGSAPDGPDSLRDLVIQSELNVINDGTAYPISTQLQVIGDIVLNNDGTGEIELRSPMDAVLAAIVCDTHPSAPATVEYDTESAITILADLILNSGRWLYPHFHYNDIAELHSRFAGVWELFSLTTADLNGLSVGDVLALVGPCMGLCVSQSADGCIDIWHPAVYRPSRRTHYFADADCAPGGCSIVDRGRDGQYGGVSVDSVLSYPIAEIPTSDGWRENLFELDTPTGIFNSDVESLSRHALGRQLMQRLCGHYYQVTLVMGLKGMQVDIGDTIALTSAVLGRTIPCLVTAVDFNPETGESRIDAIHYPDSLGLHSTWENDGVKGIWRWLDSDRAATYANMAHGTGLDADFVNATGDPAASPLPGHWQGACNNFGVSNTSLLDATADTADLFDLCMIVSGDLTNPTGPTVAWIDPDVGPVMAWILGDDSAIVLFWAVPAGGTGAEHASNNRLALGYTLDYTTATIAWEWVEYLPYASIGRTDQGSADATAVDTALALEWRNTSLRLYVERRLMLEVTEATADKGDWTGATLYVNRGSTSSYIGCFRHLRQASNWIAERQRIQGANGLDPYYGPDTL